MTVFTVNKDQLHLLPSLGVVQRAPAGPHSEEARNQQNLAIHRVPETMD